MVHPTNAYLDSWIPKILSLRKSKSLKPYAGLFIVLILLSVPSKGPVEFYGRNMIEYRIDGQIKCQLI